MTVSICRSCRYEQSDCNGVKSIDTVRCDFFKERLATNYPARIRELEGLLEQADRKWDTLLSRYKTVLEVKRRFQTECKNLKNYIGRLEHQVGIECRADCDKCENKCRAWQNGFNAKGGNLSFDSVMMLRRIVDEVTPEWYGNNCISCAWFNNLKGVGGYCAYHNKKTTAKGGCNKWAKECDTE